MGGGSKPSKLGDGDRQDSGAKIPLRDRLQVPLVGVGGHSGHGKTRLVAALSGVDIERLKSRKAGDEKTGMAAHATLGFSRDERATLVDLPGASGAVGSFIGATFGASFFVLAVSATDGPKQQTYEHLHIYKLLGIRTGLIAVTKSDLVNGSSLRQVLGLIDELLAYAGFEGVQALPVSTKDRSGIDELYENIRDLCRRTVNRSPIDGPTRFYVERAMIVRSVGTVVTGILGSGALRARDKVIFLPARRQCTVTAIQVLDKAVKRVRAVERVAIGLEGVSEEEIEGNNVMVLEEEGYPPTFTIQADVELLKTARVIRSSDELTLHHGPCSTPAKATPLSHRQGPIDPGAKAHVRLQLERPLVLAEGDRFVLRSAAGTETVGGGVVTDAASRRWIRVESDRGGGKPASKKKKRKAGPRILSGHEMVVEHLNEAHKVLSLLEMDGCSPRSAWNLAEVINLSVAKTKRLLSELASQGSLVKLGDGPFFHPQAIERAREKILAVCDHEGRVGIGEIRAITATSPKNARLLIGELIRRKDVVMKGKQYVRFD